jgi:hypothetical protein
MTNEDKTQFDEDGSYIGSANLSPIPLSVSSPIIRPEDKNKIKANAVVAMHHYAEQETSMLKKQADLIHAASARDRESIECFGKDL